MPVVPGSFRLSLLTGLPILRVRALGPAPFLFMHLIRILLLVVLLTPVFGRAALTWEKKQAELAAKPGDQELVALFPFKNTGSTTVIIRNLETSCECTVAELTQRSYAPGEAGTIRAVFTVGDRMGLQNRTVTVTMDDPYAPIAVLTLRVDIPERLSYSTRMLHWSVGGSSEEKSVDVSAVGDRRIAALVPQEPVPALLTTRIEVVESGRSYRLFIRPTRLDGPATIPVGFTVRFADGEQNSFQVYALIR